MNLPKFFGAWISMPMFLAFSHPSFAQCDLPPNLLLVPPQTSTALVLKWPTVQGATQYQLRYWESSNPDDKTIVEDVGPAPFTLRGLRKNTPYTLQVRSKCGNASSDWSTSLNSATINSSGNCSSAPVGVLINGGSSVIKASWTSAGSHTLRYRLGDSGDWWIPSGALNVVSLPFEITGLSPGSYQVEIKRNCSATSSVYQRHLVTLGDGDACPTPTAPTVSPDNATAFVELPVVNGVTGYNVDYRTGTSGAWIGVGSNIPPSSYMLNPPLVPSTQYQVQIQAICTLSTSGFSPPVSFTTGQQPTGPCLANKNAGKNLSPQAILALNQQLNRPSPFSFASMIGLNDGGLVFRSFQNESRNQITLLTTQFRNFHTMDEDFDNSMVSYELNIKPKDTYPEGTPANMWYNKFLYTLYRQTHGFTNITSATELLQYWPQSWKEKIYKESDWSQSGPAGIQSSFANYTQKFIDEFAPANGTGNQILVSNFQVGNELWDYPVKADYHSLLQGAHSAFVLKYGPKSNGGWKMKLVVGAFQAYRDNNCSSILRDFSNCNGALERHDFIGDYLEVADCQLLKDLDALDCHPYSFTPGTTNWTFPENPDSEAWQIRNMAAWLNANKNSATGVLNNTRLWSTEYGFDSNPTTGVGEKTQSAYLVRGLFLHSRYHFEKVFFYNAYDVSRPTDPYYNGLYNSAGFWKLGSHTANSDWASPIEAHGATAKPVWFAMLDLKARFGEHVFHKALVEDANAFVLLIAKPDSTDPYLVFWSPQHTNDANINEDIPVNIPLNWSNALGGGYKLGTALAQTFAESTDAGQPFESSATGSKCGVALLSTIRRNPAFIRLTSCTACANVTNPGNLVPPAISSGSVPFDPETISSAEAASGGSDGSVEYQWQQSFDNSNFVNIPGANALDYNPPSIMQTSYYRRAAKRSVCSDYIFSNSVGFNLASNNCVNIRSFERHLHTMSGCNSAGDYSYKIAVDQVNANEQITLTDLPTNGINISLCKLNGDPMIPATFFTNTQFVDQSTLIWHVNASNGSAQSLQLFYCWANTYPDPVSTSMAMALCSGQSIPCAEGFNGFGPDTDERGAKQSGQLDEPSQFTVFPNPGMDHLTLAYIGAPAPLATLRIVTAAGQTVTSQNINLVKNQQWEINTSNLMPGVYFLCLQTGMEVKWVVWEKI